MPYSKPSVPDTKLAKNIERLSMVDGVVVAVGWCAPHENPTVVHNERPLAHQTVIRFDRPDVAAAHGAPFLKSGFRLASVVDFPHLMSNDKFAVRFDDGAVLRQTIPPLIDAQLVLQDFVAQVATKTGASLIEIGSRARSGNTNRGLFPGLDTYTGIDVVPGPNVDIVADAHRLSHAVDRQYDFGFSVSVFEHLIMPWVAAYELGKVLKIGGMAYIQSHPTWPLHEEPWDFFRFSRHAWSGIFNRFTGFEIIRTGHGIAASIIAVETGAGALQGLDVQPTCLLSSCLVRKVSGP
ncbi:MAG: hypothetical protein Q7J57_11260 [Gemmobacter sp.]|nr:hypothetical protein [Gemmobacter sp.]